MKELKSQMIKSIYCSVLKRIEINDEVINDLIRTKEFQRLNRIKQLGVVHYLFPGSTHTRYSHSLGVFELTRRVLKHLEQKNNIDKQKQLLIKIAALLHDLGHGPLSHFFEEINSKKHEEYTVEIILSDKTDISKVLKKHLQSKEIEEIVKIIKKEHKIKWINQIISSDVDVDRLDYLIRDSFYTGVKYGDIDLDWLINNMVIFNNELAFKTNAIEVVESFIFGRYHMYTSVYLNLKSLAFSEQICLLFNQTKRLISEDYKFNSLDNKYKNFLSSDKSPLKVGEFLDLNDDNLFSFIEDMGKETDPLLEKISQNILSGTLPKIFDLTNPESNSEFYSRIKGKIEGIDYKIIKQDNSFNNISIKSEDSIQDDPKFLVNEEIESLFNISTILNKEFSKNKHKIMNKEIGIIVI